jgi:hypothetical protein
MRLTDEQKKLFDYIEKKLPDVYFRRNKEGEEQCFVGSKRVDDGLFFFFYGIGYFQLSGKSETKMYEYFYMDVLTYKIDEYLDSPNK